MRPSKRSLRQSIKSLIDELKARKVLRVGVGYVVVAWLMMQVGEILFEALLLPGWSNSLLVSLVILGFPVALVLAWAYEITPAGIELDHGAHEQNQPPPALSEAPFHSITVHPFQDLSADASLGALCRGIAEETTLALGQVEGLCVVDCKPWLGASQSTGSTRPTHHAEPVSLVVKGSVRLEGGRYRVSASLLSGMTQHLLWARSFEYDGEDAFELEDRVASAVARVLRLSADDSRLETHIESDPMAYESFLCGLRYLRLGKDKNRLAQQMFRRAVDIDPGFGKAWGYLACATACQYMYEDSSDKNRAAVRQMSERALQLAPALAMSHVAAGLALCLEGRFEASDNEFEQAVAIDPESFDAWYFYARSQVHQGRTKRAVRLFDQAATVDRQDYQSLLLKASQLIQLGRHDLAQRALTSGLGRTRSHLELHPDDWRAWNLGAIAHLRLGHREEAEDWLQTSLENAPRDSTVNYNAACFYALAGDPKRAIQFLRESIGNGSVTRRWVEQDPDLVALHGEPEFDELLEKFQRSAAKPALARAHENRPD